MRRYRGIEPIIAVVILIAVTIVIAIGVVGWIMGWWGAFGAVESLRVYPDSHINAGNDRVFLRIKNEGSAAAVIYKIEVVGVKELSIPGNEITLTPGQEVSSTFSFDGDVSLTAGVTYTVKIYTRAGNVITVAVQAR